MGMNVTREVVRLLATMHHRERVRAETDPRPCHWASVTRAYA